MGKTLQVAADRAHDEKKSVLPAEYARGLYIKNIPSLQALKLMHLMMATASGRMAEDVRHDIRLSDIRKIVGMNNHTKKSLRALFEELRAAVLTYEDPEKMRFTVGGFLDEASADYRHEVAGDVLVSWYFGRTFRNLAEKSDHWAILDRQTVFHFSSKYAVLLYQHIISLAPLKHSQSRVFTVADLRGVLGVQTGKLSSFSNLKLRAINPAIAEINQLSRYTLTTTTKKIGRAVVGIEISWKPKAEVLIEPLSEPKAVRRINNAETPALAFPATGSIEWSKPWNEIARLHGNGKDKDLIAQDFRNWCQSRSIPLDKAGIEKMFEGFCRRAKI